MTYNRLQILLAGLDLIGFGSQFLLATSHCKQ